MPKVLILTDPSPDYGADYIYDGFCHLFGAASVLDYPLKRTLHGEKNGFDCNLDWPAAYAANSQEYPFQLLADADIDLIVVSNLRQGQLSSILRIIRPGNGFKLPPIAFCDMEDSSRNLASQSFGLPLADAYFKRELLPGHPGVPLPFGYPEDRIKPPLPYRIGIGAMFHVWTWCEEPRGLRAEIAHHLAINYSREQRLIQHITTDRGKEPRLSKDEYLDKLSDCCAAICPQGAGYFTNRLFETAARGVAPIIEIAEHQDYRSLIRSPERDYEFPFNLAHVLAFSNMKELDHCIKACIAHPDEVAKVGLRAQRHVLAHHTTRVRAQTICDHMGVKYEKLDRANSSALS